MCVRKMGRAAVLRIFLHQSCCNAIVPNITRSHVRLCLHNVLPTPGPAAATAAAGPDAVHIKKGIRDQDHLDSKPPTTATNVSAAAGAGAGAAAAADGAAAAGGAPVGPQKLQSFRLSYEDVFQEEQLQEELDDTIKSPSVSAAGLPDGSEYHIC